ncbi:MAG TPA: Hsp70 family protein [Gemmataceae bacterium]|jgi:molecular chaperone DnaK|nr:Hsp70 family protein [Gemmataceae bacterium]
MKNRVLDVYLSHANRLILQTAQSIAGQPKQVLLDVNHYRQKVVEPIWNQLPVPMRLLGKDQLRWEDIMLAMRTELFVAGGDGRIGIRPDAGARLDALTRRLLAATGDSGTKLAGAKPAAAVPPAVPVVPMMAVPVKPAGPMMAQPLVPMMPIPIVPTQPITLSMDDVVLEPPMPVLRPVAPQAPASSPRLVPVKATSNIALGIDLGTTYSVIAHLDATGRPTSIPNAAGDLTTPSVVLFEDGNPVVGKEAVMAAAMEPERVAVCAKRDMGSKMYRKKINGEHLPPEVISSLILKAMLADAKRKLGPDVGKAVITVPAYFDESRRRATTDAGRLAGLEVLDIINEPTAAALCFGYQLGFLDVTGKAKSDAPIKILVYDLGGGTFDVTIVEIQGSSFKALATDGDVALGGKDFDDALVNLACERFIHQHREDPRGNPTSLMELQFAAEVAKKTLTERPKATIYVNHLGTRMKVDVTRDEFEEKTAPLVGRTKTTTEIVMRQAGLKWDQLDRVLLVGGSSRMPQVGAMLRELTGKEPDRSVSPDEAVAHGAVLYADLLVKKGVQGATGTPNFSITNINSHSLGIVGLEPGTGRRKNQILIPKNTQLPTSVTRTFKTSKPNQQTVVIRIVEGESERPEACIQVGVCTATNLPPNLSAGTPVQVTYAYGEDGQLEVTAQVLGGKEIKTIFQRENNMDGAAIQLWSEYLSTLPSA